MQLTTNLGLKKPGLLDYVNVNDLNDNSDILDIAVKALQDGVNDIPTLETINKSIAGAINELKGSFDKVEDGSVTIAQLETVSKTLLGAINELKQRQDVLGTDISNLAGVGRTTETVKQNADAIAGVSAQMADTATNISNVIKIKKNITIATLGWIDDTLTSGFWKYDITDEDITIDTVVDINIHLNDLEKASDVKSSNLSDLGRVTLYAEDKPTENILCDLKLIREVI